MKNTFFQVNLFGDFKDITPTADNVTKFLFIISQHNLLPNTFNEINPNFPGSSNPRLSFNSIRKDFNIEIPSDRISISQSINIFEPEQPTLEKFVETVKEILTELFRVIDKKSNRLAFITNSLGHKMTDDKLESMYEKFNNLNFIYDTERPFEWSTKAVVKNQINLNALNETINVITEVSRVQGQFINSATDEIDFDRLHLKFDINTNIENSSQRFDFSDFSTFIEQSMSKRQALLTKITEKIDE